MTTAGLLGGLVTQSISESKSSLSPLDESYRQCLVANIWPTWSLPTLPTISRLRA